MKNYTPSSNKAELMITYRCSLVCVNCNRFSFLKNPHTPDMTVEDVKEFFRQCAELDWNPDIIVIGGEPTIHENLEEIIILAREFKGNGLVQMWSNAYLPGTMDMIKYYREKYAVSIPEATFKTKSQILKFDDYFVSPKDFGMTRQECWQHSNTICGISVDSKGYMPCSVGGMIDGVLKLGLRTKRLADLFDNEICAEITRKMCENCGACLTTILPSDEQITWRKNVEGCKKKYGSYLSETWMAATEGMR